MAENIKKFVVDASFALAYLLPSEKSNSVDNIFEGFKEGRVNLVSVRLFPFEVINGLRGALIKKRISFQLANRLMEGFLKLDIDCQEINFRNVFPLAARYNLSIYDAAYLSLSLKKQLPLLTLDQQLKKLAKRFKV